jgi:microcystin-dependent protein
MHRIDGAGHVDNRFVAEDIQTHRPPTEITADIMNALQEELANFIEYAGVSLSKADNAQLRDALVASFAKKGSTIRYIRQIWTIVEDTEALLALENVPNGSDVIVTNWNGAHGMASWNGATWTTVPLLVSVFDLYGTDADNHGYYWFSGQWNQFDVAALTVGEASEIEAGIARFATAAETLAGEALNAAVAPAHLAAYARIIVPAGSVFWFARNTPPAGYLECNGALISRAAYAQLFEAIGATFGEGDGVTTFALPDLRGEFVRGWDNGRGVDPGRAFGTWQEGTLTGEELRTGGPDVVSLAYNVASAALSTARLAFGMDTPRKTIDANICRTGTLAPADALSTNSVAYGITRPANVSLLACIRY